MSAKFISLLFPKKTGPWIFILFLFSVLFVPDFWPKPGLHLGVEEILIPLMLLHMALYPGKLIKGFTIFIIVFSLYILFTILLNFSTQTFSDYFEVYKILKYGIIVLFMTGVFEENKNLFDITLRIFLPLLLLFNMLHYFNVLGFNQIIEPYYALSEIHLKNFGVDSLGNPAVKRMLGTAGNPNMNALIFLFFLTYFLSKLDSKKINGASVFVFMSLFGLGVCQSRTTMVAGILVVGKTLLIRRFSIKSFSLNAVIIFAAILAGYFLSKYSYNYFTNTLLVPSENHSIQGRLSVWEILWEMVLQKPVFGHGPTKSFFYERVLYSDGEYILYLWRYGFIGLLFYLWWLISPLFRNFHVARKNGFFLLFVIGLLISAITNNPLSDPMILSLFALATAHQFAYNEVYKSANT
ncbi:hypothetical protein SDC9_48460 [bioreactor metagenome]|uniref:O-antigen ligase-related domain-containing protein n=1 Tax=bioreactor metagenome TaxID=1076179 RepID=A0A644WED8_9ZZZZ